MSFLTSSLAGVSKAVISFWFRVPGTTLDEAKEAFKNDGSNPRFNGITPLVVFGADDVQGHSINSPVTSTETYVREGWTRTDPVDFPDDVNDGTVTFGEHEFNITESNAYNRNSFGYVAGESIAKDPCYIGIDCNKEPTLVWDGETTRPNVLRINLQLTGTGSGAGLGYSSSLEGPALVVGFKGTNTFLAGGIGGTVIPQPVVLPEIGTANIIAQGGLEETFARMTDASSIAFAGETECCIIKTSRTVTPNRWHHVLLSFDLTGSIGATGRQYSGYNGFFPIPPSASKGKITTGCKIWLAYDNRNISGPALLKGSFAASKTEAPKPNDLFTQNAANTAQAVGDIDHTIGPQGVAGGEGSWVSIHTVSGLSLPSYSYTPSSISGDLGMPATTKFIDNVRHIEMAELQIFTGITLDTSKAANRKAFIYKGKPVPAAKKRDPSKPDSFSGSIEFFGGKQPDVLLHGSTDWIKGKNTGTSNQFAPTGTILRYRPDPSLGGPQGKPQ